MQLLRFGEERTGLLKEGRVYETDGRFGIETGASFALGEVHLLPPVVPGKIVCVGRNYAKHIKEMSHAFGGDRPKEPGLFLKAPNTLAGPNARISYPGWTQELHYEGELAVVISRTMRNVPQDQALDYVLGYTCALDLTARDKQKSDLQWVRAKSADGFCPLGPWLETQLEPGGVMVRTRVGGELRQEASTSEMLFSTAEVLSYISGFMTLEPDDLVLTGTPEGVGPLSAGDSVEVDIEGIGVLHTQII